MADGVELRLLGLAGPGAVGVVGVEVVISLHPAPGKDIHAAGKGGALGAPKHEQL
jgi:hypothetical protein